HINAIERSGDDTSNSMRAIEIHAEVNSFAATGGAKRIIRKKKIDDFSLGSELEEIRILKNIILIRPIDRQSLLIQEIELLKLKLDLKFVVTEYGGKAFVFAAKLFIKKGEINEPIRRDKSYEAIKIENFDQPEIEFF